MTTKNSAWKAIKKLRDSFNFDENDLNKLNYPRSTKIELINELARMKRVIQDKNLSLITPTPKQKVKRVNLNNFARIKSSIWRNLPKSYILANKLNYRNLKLNDLKKHERISKIRSETLMKDIKLYNLKKFLSNPALNAQREVDFEVEVYDLIEAMDFIKQSNDYFIRMNYSVNGRDEYKVLSNVEEFIEQLEKIEQGLSLNEIEEYGSDTALFYDAIRYGELITLKWIKAVEDGVYKKRSGAFFKWFNCMKEIDLKRYQIFTEDESINPVFEKLQRENCLLYAFRMSGLNEQDIDNLKLSIFNKEIPASNLPKIASRLNIKIVLTIEGDKRGRVFNPSASKEVKLGLVDNHYFINEPTRITKRALYEYEAFKDNELFPSIPSKSKKKQNVVFLSSFQVVSLIYQLTKSAGLNLLKPISLATIRNIETVDKINDYTSIREIQTECRCESRCENENFCETIEFRDYNISGEKTPFKGFFQEGMRNPNEDYDIIFIDTETFIPREAGYHIPFNVEAIYYKTSKETLMEDVMNNKLEITDNDRFYKQSFYGLDCAKDFIKSIKKDSIIIAHNMAFDFRCFVDFMDEISNCIETGTKLKTLQAKVYTGEYTKLNKKTNKIETKKAYKHLLFKDSYSFLSSKLADLPKQFNLKTGDKDIYPYTLINESNYDSFVPYKEAVKHIPAGMENDFYNNVVKAGALIQLQEEDLFDIKKYTIHYCKQDTKILAHAYTCFRKQVLKITHGLNGEGLDIINLISTPQLADEFFRLMNVFEDIYTISGIAQDFIRRCCVGGRVMCSQNKKWHVRHQPATAGEKGYTLINGVKIEHNKKEYTDDELKLIKSGINQGLIADFDAVSLYPSAMMRLKGYVKGLPKMLSEEQIKNFHFIKQDFDAYYVQIQILSKTPFFKERDFPLLSIKDKAGIRNFTNDLEGQTMYVDNITLEDIEEFQGINYKVIQGYYFNEGFNTNIHKAVQFMFDERKKLKKAGNPLQNTYKLILNASYGKLLQKAIKTEKKFVSSKDINKFVIRNYKFIDRYHKINEDLYAIKMKKSVINHFSAVHLASNILSSSKRIMNEVMCLAEDNNIKILYQDTDSMHIFNNAIPVLEKAFKAKYGRELIGSDMGQFHSDFEVNERGAKNILSTEAYFLGKKCYIDKLRYDSAEGIEKYDYHVRMKGVPTQSVKDYADEENLNIMTVYDKLFNSERLNFSMEKYCPLEICNDFRARKKTTGLYRSLKF
jgi:hypothetical protein